MSKKEEKDESECKNKNSDNAYNKLYGKKPKIDYLLAIKEVFLKIDQKELVVQEVKELAQKDLDQTLINLIGLSYVEKMEINQRRIEFIKYLVEI